MLIDCLLFLGLIWALDVLIFRHFNKNGYAFTAIDVLSIGGLASLLFLGSYGIVFVLASIF